MLLIKTAMQLAGGRGHGPFGPLTTPVHGKYATAGLRPMESTHSSIRLQQQQHFPQSHPLFIRFSCPFEPFTPPFCGILFSALIEPDCIDQRIRPIGATWRSQVAISLS